MHERGDMNLTTSTYSLNITKTKMREFARQRGFRNPIGVRCDKWRLERQKKAEEESTRKEAKGGDKITDAGLERTCCCIMC